MQGRALREIFGGGGGGGRNFQRVCLSVRLRYANLSNIMLGISNLLFNYCNVHVTITLYAYTGCIKKKCNPTLACHCALIAGCMNVIFARP